MIAYVSVKENLYIMEYIKQIKDITIEPFIDKENISSFLSQLSTSSHYTDIIIDLSAFDKKDNIEKSIFSIRSNTATNIIVIALEYDIGSSLLSYLFSLGIYNIISLKDDIKKELEICLTKGKIFSDSIKYNIPTEVKVKENGKVVIKKESKFIKQTVTIAVCGSMDRIGTTTQALAITKYITENSKHCCYIESNKSGHIKSVADIYTDIIEEKKIGLVKYNDIDMFYNISNISEIMSRGYEFIIYDYGVLDDNNISSFLEKDIKIICSGTKPWEMRTLLSNIFPKTAELTDIYYIFNFCSKSERSDVISFMEEKADYTCFTDYRPDIFDKISLEMKLTYKKILSDFLETEVMLEEEKPKNKFKLFKKF